MMTFEELQALVAHCTKPDGPDIYRRLYGMRPGVPSRRIASWDEWHSLPPLTKEFLSAIPFAERTFMPLEEIDHVRVSSGTSGNAPVFTPRMLERGLEYRLSFHTYERPLLSFLAPMMPHWHEQFLKAHDHPGRIIVYDPRNPAASIRIAKIAGVDAISVFTYQIRWIGEHMRREGMNESIRAIDMTGERCSRAQLDYILSTFPNARVYETYGASELHDPDAGVPCQPLSREHPQTRYHAKRTHFLELLDPASGTPLEAAAGAQGDLLISAYAGEPASFPLIRLRLGDTIRIEETQCDAHGEWTYSVVGRTDHDFVRVPGGVLAVDEVERVMVSLAPAVSDHFVLHVRETPSAHGPRFGALIEAELGTNADAAEIARTIEARLRINPQFTWADGVADGRFLPLEVRQFEHRTGLKHRRIVRD